MQFKSGTVFAKWALVLVFVSNQALAQLPANTLEPDTANNKKNIIERMFDAGLIITPLLFYTPETEFGGAIAGFYSFRLSKDTLQRPSSIRAALALTSRGQFIFDVPFEITLDQNRWVFDGLFNTRTYPYDFYGVGNDISLDTLESYTYTTINIELDVLRRLGKGIFIGPRFNFEDYRVTASEPNGLLENSGLSGTKRGLITGVGLAFLVDKRPNIFFPEKGYYLRLNSFYYDPSFGGDFEFYDIEIDARKYLKLKDDMVFAMQGYTRNVFQDPPFLRLSQLGGKRMLRGYFEGAYQDERYMAFQGEYRWMFSKHFGFTVFGAVGGVSPHIRQVFDNPLYAYGSGFRFRFNTKEKISARFDYGIGKNTSNFYFTIGEAF